MRNIFKLSPVNDNLHKKLNLGNVASSKICDVLTALSIEDYDDVTVTSAQYNNSANDEVIYFCKKRYI